MKLINGFDLVEHAKAHNLILPAFNTTNMEMTYGIASGLNNAGLPGYIQISSSNLRLSNPEMIAKMARDATEKFEIPIGLHLDHGKSFEDVKKCVDAGFTSIMIDASHLDFEDNIEMCKKIVEYCHFYGIPVEVELGSIQGKEDEMVSEAESKTDPDRVADFVSRTNCDLLAVSVGNVHGFAQKPKIDLPLLERINNVSEVPLVLHGGSGIPQETIWEARKLGLIKINYGSSIRRKFIETFGEAYKEDPSIYDVINLSLQSVENVEKEVEKLTRLINHPETD